MRVFCEVAVVPQLPCYRCYSNRTEMGTTLALHVPSPLQILWSVQRRVDDNDKVVQKEVRSEKGGVLSKERRSDFTKGTRSSSSKGRQQSVESPGKVKEKAKMLQEQMSKREALHLPPAVEKRGAGMRRGRVSLVLDCFLSPP